MQNYLRKVKYEYRSDQYFENQQKRKYYDIFWSHQFLFTTFPQSSLDDIIDFLAHEKLTDQVKIWHLHSRTMLQNFRKISSGDFKLSPFLSLNDSTDKNAFGQFGWIKNVRTFVSVPYPCIITFI